MVIFCLYTEVLHRGCNWSKNVRCLLCLNASKHARFVVKLHFKDLFPNNNSHPEVILVQHLELFYKTGQEVDFAEDCRLLPHRTLFLSKMFLAKLLTWKVPEHID